MMPRGENNKSHIKDMLCGLTSSFCFYNGQRYRCDYSYRKQDTVPADGEYSQV